MLTIIKFYVLNLLLPLICIFDAWEQVILIVKEWVFMSIVPAVCNVKTPDKGNLLVYNCDLLVMGPHERYRGIWVTNDRNILWVQSLESIFSVI